MNNEYKVIDFEKVRTQLLTPQLTNKEIIELNQFIKALEIKQMSRDETV